jgi:hypothetical protein
LISVLVTGILVTGILATGVLVTGVLVTGVLVIVFQNKIEICKGNTLSINQLTI